MNNFNMMMTSAGERTFSNTSNVGKKAVHVKWSGKTIALGTFHHAEAEEKCARAKALTRAWRSTMRPKPTREWVMLELERLGVRVVSGRLGRRGEGNDEGGEDENSEGGDSEQGGASGGNNSRGMNKFGNIAMGNMGMGIGDNTGIGNMLGGGGGGGGNGNSNPCNNRPMVGGGSAAAYEAARADHYRKLEDSRSGNNKGDVGGNNNPQDNLSMMNATAMSTGMSGMNNTMPGDGEGNALNMPAFGPSVNPNQHYEMLKLHHMNLLNEIQETTLMMNLYQQQQLQQQQRGNCGGGGGNTVMPANTIDGMNQNSGNNKMGDVDGMAGSGRGGGDGASANGAHNKMGLVRVNPMGSGSSMGNPMGSESSQTMNQNQGMGEDRGMGSGGGNNGGSITPQALPQNNNFLPSQQERCNSAASSNIHGIVPSNDNSPTGVGGRSTGSKTDEERLRHLKDDISQHAKEAAKLEASLDMNKQKNEEDGGHADGREEPLPSEKRQKKQEDDCSTPI